MQEKDLYILKVGTNTLLDDAGVIRDFVVSEILESAKSLLARDKNVLIVTSGAATLGRIILNDKITSKKIQSSIGQPVLFGHYKRKSEEIGLLIAEILLTKPNIAERDQFLSLQETFNEMFDKGIIPIVNENDVLVSGFDGNDPLACDLAISLGAKKLILVSNINGLYDSDPTKNKDAKFIPEVDNITDDFLKYCSKDVSENSTGGMLSKLKVARIASVVGIETEIVNGLVPGNLLKTISGTATGTIFKARKIEELISNRYRWILVGKNSNGSIQIDDGAVAALKSGKSLLAVGVKRVYGEFDSKQIIEVIDRNSHGIAFGIVDFSKDYIEKIINSEDAHQNQLIHANNMFILK